MGFTKSGTAYGDNMTPEKLRDEVKKLIQRIKLAELSLFHLGENVTYKTVKSIYDDIIALLLDKKAEKFLCWNQKEFPIRNFPEQNVHIPPINVKVEDVINCFLKMKESMEKQTKEIKSTSTSDNHPQQTTNSNTNANDKTVIFIRTAANINGWIIITIIRTGLVKPKVAAKKLEKFNSDPLEYHTFRKAMCHYIIENQQW